MNCQFLTLEQVPLELTRQDVLGAIAPYVSRHVDDADPAWRAAVETKARTTRRTLWRRRLTFWHSGLRRTVAVTESKYNEGWSRTDWDGYATTAKPANGSPWEWDDVRVLASNIAGARARLWFLMRAIALLNPRSVLEIGSGPGVNLLPLACRFPHIRFEGVELSTGGIEKSRASQEEETLPAGLQSFSPEPVVDLTAHRRVRFTKGSAAELPFRDGEFDLVYSSLALEQMEPIRHQALKEFARVTGRHAVMIEPFADVNTTSLRRAYVAAHDYFQGAVGDLPNYGLHPLWTTRDMPQKLWLGTALVVSEKRRDL